MGIDMGKETVSLIRKEYEDFGSCREVADNAAQAFAWFWHECYAEGRLTEGEFAKMSAVELSIAWQRYHELRRDPERGDFEGDVYEDLMSEYGEGKMAEDFTFRPWRFAS